MKKEILVKQNEKLLDEITVSLISQLSQEISDYNRNSNEKVYPDSVLRLGELTVSFLKLIYIHD